jgi:hypothetical protein
LNESKLSYLAIALSVGAILMSGLTAGISALPNSASLAAQHEELSRHKKELNRQSGLAADSEQRLRDFPSLLKMLRQLPNKPALRLFIKLSQ